MNAKRYEVGEKVIDKSIWNTHIFEVVDEFPDGYIVWNIGRKNFPYENYVPLCKRIKGTYSVDTNTLKMVYMGSENDALYVLKKASWGTVGKKLFQKILRGDVE